MKTSYFILIPLILLTTLACRLPVSLAGQASPTPAVLADTFFSGYAFIDSNANGELDASDPPLEAARFVVAGFSGPTGKDGHATVVIPGGWDKPVTAHMLPPEEGGYTLIGPAEVTLQSRGPTRADFIFAAPSPGAPRQETATAAPSTTADARLTPPAPAALISSATPPPPLRTKPAAARPGRQQNDLVYCTTTAGVPLKMDLLYPSELQSPAPLVVYVHGGGWESGDKHDGAGALFFPTLLEAGYIVAAINYRLAPDYLFPAQIEDVRCAIRHLRAKAAAYGIDPQRIGAIGGSAGGHLVALLGAADDNPPWPAEAYQESYAGQSNRIQAVVDLFGPADLSGISLSSEAAGAHTVRQAFGDDPATWQAFSPVTYVTSDDPPFLILHGDRDNVVPLRQSQILYDHLHAAAVPSQFVVVQNAGHGFRPTGGDLQPGIAALRQLVAEFFNSHLQ